MYNSTCDHPGCSKDQVCATDERGKLEGYCKDHAAEHGVCYFCGAAFTVFTAFSELNESGICNDCRREITELNDAMRGE